MVAWALRRRSERANATRGGFTLLETLVAAGVIIMLAATLIPVVLRARAQAASLGCASNLRTVGQALNLLRTERGSYPQRGQQPADPDLAYYEATLDSIGEPLARKLLNVSLGRPELLYCPTSLAKDLKACRPFKKNSKGKITPEWQTGYISYIYLAGISCSFADSDGQPTFDPQREAPDLSRSPRVVLAGDRTVELAPDKANANIPGSNHGREGGWFCFTTGDVQWWSWNRLTAHPGPGETYTWYWPRVIQPQQHISASSGGP